MIYLDPGDGGGSGGSGGSGGAPATPWVRLYPTAVGIPSGLFPASIIVSWGSGAPTPTLAPGGPYVLTNGGAVLLGPAVTTTYTLSAAGAPNATCVVTTGVTAGSVRRWADIRWSYTEPAPVGSCVGFDVLIYLGVDIANTNSWIAPPVRVPSTDRRLVYPLTLPPPQTVGFAVRPVYEYAQRVSPWVSVGAPLTFS